MGMEMGLSYQHQRNIDAQSPPEPVDVDYADADAEIAANLVSRFEVDELVQDVRASAGLLNWISHNVQLPYYYLKEFRALDHWAKRFDREADAIVERDLRVAGEAP